MTITLNFTSIFAWIGGLVCALVMLWALGWLIRGVLAMGEFLGIWEALGQGIRGIWEALGRGIRGSISWVWSTFVRR